MVGAVEINSRVDAAVNHSHNNGLQFLAVKHLIALLVDKLSLAVHNIVVLENALSDGEVSALYLLLRALDGVGYHLCLNRHILGSFERVHYRGYSFAAEKSHKVILKGEEETACAGVALSARASAELIVYSSGFMALRADYEKTARLANSLSLRLNLLVIFLFQSGIFRSRVEDFLIVGFGKARRLGDKFLGIALSAKLRFGKIFGITAELDIGSAACHIGSYGYGVFFTRLCNDFRLFFVVLGVQNLMLYALPFEQGAEKLGFFD